MKLKTLSQTYNDGVVSIYAVGNIAEPGNMKKTGLTFKCKRNYQRRQAGLTRIYLAKQDMTEIERVMRTPWIANISVHDVAITEDGVQYDISIIQDVLDIDPWGKDLTLSKLEVAYEIGTS